METDPPLNGEFMRDTSSLFDWEVDSIEKLENWGARGSEVWGDAEALPNPRLDPPEDPSPIDLVLEKLAGEGRQS